MFDTSVSHIEDIHEKRELLKTGGTRPKHVKDPSVMNLTDHRLANLKLEHIKYFKLQVYKFTRLL